MKTFELTVLGANSATPFPGRFSSSFVLNYDHELALIDCGEGAQIKMNQFRIKVSRINHIFISHLHGDHIFGLPGFLHSFNLNGRNKPLHLYAPVGIKMYLDVIQETTGGSFNFPLIIQEMDHIDARVICRFNDVDVRAFPMKHRIPTYGYRFDESPLLAKIDSQAIASWHMTIEEIKAAKAGKSIIRDGAEIGNDQLTLPRDRARSFSYCSDTIYDPSLIPYIRGSDTLYHEATYLHALQDKARERMHATSKEAGLMARQSGVTTLLIGHYSSRYDDVIPLQEEARLEHARTFVVSEGETYSV